MALEIWQGSPSGGPPGRLHGDLGSVWEVCESVLAGFGTVCGGFGSVLLGSWGIWGALRVFLNALGVFLGCLGEILGGLGAVLGAMVLPSPPGEAQLSHLGSV